MTKDEFLYDHDLDSVLDLLSRYVALETGQHQEDNVETSKVQQVNAKEFFL